MSNALEALLIAASILIMAFVIGVGTSVSDKGVDLFNDNTEEVKASADMLSGFSNGMFDGTVVTTDAILEAAQECNSDYEIRYQTLMHKKAAVSYKVFPGTEKDIEAVVGELALIDPSSADYLNPDAMWAASINEDDGYIMFKQEK